jgi:glutamine synthetase
MMSAVTALKEAIGVHEFESVEAHMKYCAETIRPLMEEVRVHVDALEGMVTDELWPFPKYQEMLFIR